MQYERYESMPAHRNRPDVVYPLATGPTIAAYTVVDGIGVRQSGSPLGYIGWLFALFAFPIVLTAIVSRRARAIDFLHTRRIGRTTRRLTSFREYRQGRCRCESRQIAVEVR